MLFALFLYSLCTRARDDLSVFNSELQEAIFCLYSASPSTASLVEIVLTAIRRGSFRVWEYSINYLIFP